MHKNIFIKNKKILSKIKLGYPWIFSNELNNLPDYEDGEIVNVLDKSNNPIGLGFYNRHSLISVRLLHSEIFNYELIENRILSAFHLRQKLIDTPNYCRLIYGESDFLPGLIIDRYGDYFSIEILSAGFEKKKDWVVEALIKIFPNTKGIIQKNNSIWRVREGLSDLDEILFGNIPEEIVISENNIKYHINLQIGQKTGYFYDQRLNRAFLKSISYGSVVLDLFCNQGGFALNAASGGAKLIEGVDIQKNAIEMARKNSQVNNFSNINFFEGDCFDFLKQTDKKYDVIISDPPAFTKSKKNVAEAIGAYYQINKLAIRKLNKNGILLTSSCSQHIYEDKFYSIVQKAAHDNKKQLRLIYRGMQSPDHPILDIMPETKYLKFFGFVVD